MSPPRMISDGCTSATRAKKHAHACGSSSGKCTSLAHMISGTRAVFFADGAGFDGIFFAMA